MADADTTKDLPESDVLVPTASPLVFISHDTRDAEIAEAFSKLLKSVSAGMIKTFRSSDKKGNEGIDFGEEWFKRIMNALQSTSDIVCLFTERSIDRPWILFEAGVAKGKLGTPVVGVACGVPLSRVSAGPFYQFQNMDDSEADLTKLILQLARRIPGLELDTDVVKSQVGIFRTTETEILKKIGTSLSAKERKESADEGPIAKLVEEMKALPSRVAERLNDTEEPVTRRRRLRRIHPAMIDEMMHIAGASGDPIGILVSASLIRDDAPWLYELAMEVYRVAKSGSSTQIERELSRVHHLAEMLMRGPFAEEFSLGDKQTYMLLREFPRMLHHVLDRTLARRTKQARRRSTRSTQGKLSAAT